MTYCVRAFLDNELHTNRTMEHLPSKGDTVRVFGDAYAIVTEVVWCFDESTRDGQRVNLRLESLVTP